MIAHKIHLHSSKYPILLREIANPPKALFVDGVLPDAPHVAIVGSRRPTAYGREITHKLAYDLAKAGVVIVSGLALGIDAVAHAAAIEAGGKTVAVLGCGIERNYPTSNHNLGNKIRATGAVVSEYEIGMPPLPHHFPARNRIITGLSTAVIVTEANAESGSLITANFALEEGRLVFAVPGNVTSLRSAGPNNLLRKGAIAATSAQDIMEELNLEGLSRQPVKAKSREEAAILELLERGVNTSQQLIENSGLSAAQFANIISLMEITGKVRNLGAGNWVTR